MMQLDPKALLVVEDEPVLRQFLADHIRQAAPGVEVLSAGDGPSAWHVFRRRRPLYLVLDLSIPGYSGLALLELVGLHQHAPRVLIFSGVPQDEITLPRGITGAVVVQKFSPPEALERALLLLLSNRVLPCRRQEARTGEALLTPTELIVLGLLLEGIRPRQAAAELGVSPHTVLTHRKNIMRKLGTRSSVTLMRRAMDLGLFADSRVAVRRRLNP